MNKETKQLAVSLTFLAVLILVAISAWVFVYNRTQNARTETIKATHDLAVEEDKAEQARVLEDLIEEIAVLDAKLERYVVREKDTVQLIDRIKSLATTTRVKFELVSLAKTESNTLTLAFTAEGDYTNLVHFALLVENLPFELTIKKYSLERLLTDAELKLNPSKSRWNSTFVISIRSFISNQ